MIAFLHGDLDGVVRFNPLGPAVALLIGIFVGQAWFSLVRWGDFRDAGKGKVPSLIKQALIGLAVVEFLLWVARFFGLFGNSAFAIPETAIRSAKSVCATGHMGGRSSAACNVYLMLDSGQFREILVSSYALAGQADGATERLNAYFNDKSAKSIEVSEALLTTWLIVGVAPVLLVAIILALRWLRLHHADTPSR